MAISVQESEIGSLFVGYFDRSADPAGLAYWVGQLNSGTPLTSIAQSFSVQPEATALYPFLTNPTLRNAGDFVVAIYKDLFNREVDDAGLAWWVFELGLGRLVGPMILNIISGALHADLLTITNKSTVAVEYAQAFDAAHRSWTPADLESSRSVLAGVTFDPATVKAAETKIHDIVNPTSTPMSGSPNDDVLTGNLGNDTIDGDFGNDSINGGGGADSLTGGADHDTFVFASRATTQTAAFLASDTDAANVDKILDFTGGGAAVADVISLGTGANVFGSMTFTGATTATVTAVTTATADNFNALATAVQADGGGGVASSNAVAQIYDVTVAAGNLEGRWLIINDFTATISASDTIIRITGITGALHANDFEFA